MENQLKTAIEKALNIPTVTASDIHLEHPAEVDHGDYSTNVALIYAKQENKKPSELAEEIAQKINAQKNDFLEKVEVAGSGFINFYLSRIFFERSVRAILVQKENYGRNNLQKGKKIIIEYTDPNPFKEFHIGHLMSNSIGESLSRIIEFSGAEVKRANYQGDVGLHVAKALWGLRGKKTETLDVRVLGEAYVNGAQAYEDSKEAKGEIDEINKKIYEGNDDKLNALYEEGKRISLSHFETIYKRLGTHFDFYFFEKETGKTGKDIVAKHLGDVFEVSDGATVFRGEKYNLHTRVFITKDGYPTYEAKELGLAKKKTEIYPHDISIVVTGNEVRDYFKVLLKVLELVNPKIAEKTKHIPHGMLRLPSGKMSSRKGDIITAVFLLDEANKTVLPKVMENKEIDRLKQEQLADIIAVGSVKYSILKQAIGNDITFDFNTALSFEGNSGAYLQYTYARAQSVLRKVEGATMTFGEDIDAIVSTHVNNVERILYRFPETVERAQREYAPHCIATFLIELAQAFNNFYANERILDAGVETTHRIMITKAVSHTLKNGLHLLGIEAPEKM